MKMDSYLAMVFDSRYAVALLLLLPLFLITIERWTMKKKTTKSGGARLPPGPTGLPVVGSIPFLERDLHRYFANLSRAHGPVFSLRLGSATCVVLSSPSAVREALKDNDAVLANHQPSAASVAAIGRRSFGMIFSPYGPRWRGLRRAAMQELLSGARLDSIAGLREREVRRAVAAALERAREGAPVAVWELAFGATTNMMLRMLLGDSVTADHGTMASLTEVIDDTVRMLAEPDVSDFFPTLAPLDLQDLIVGGTDTTSTTIEWAMAELLRNPEAMRRAQTEINGVVGDSRRVSEADISRMPYLEAVVREAQRLHPAVPLLVPHSPSSACTVGGYLVPKGAKVFFNVWAMQRDPSIWEEPLEFLPERFLGTNAAAAKFGGDGSFAYIPFGAGRRACPGVALAARAIMLTLASLLHAFEWSLPPGVAGAGDLDMTERFGLVLKMAAPLVVLPAARLPDPLLYA